jgi:hypothetical protein
MENRYAFFPDLLEDCCDEFRRLLISSIRRFRVSALFAPVTASACSLRCVKLSASHPFRPAGVSAPSRSGGISTVR